MKKSTKYLNENLLPLIESIKPKRSQSYILDALNLNRYSSQSVLIQIGVILEHFWNKVISDSSVKNLIEDNNMIDINGKPRQVDHLFEDNDGRVVYLESKCNILFDSEKRKASNRKVQEIKEKVNADEAGYFVPIISTIDQKYNAKYAKKGMNVYGVKWLLNEIDAPFTEKEFFTYIEKVVKPVLVDKGL